MNTDKSNTLNRETLLSPEFINLWESLQQGVMITDKKTACLYMNTTQRKFDHLDKINVLGKTQADLYPKTNISHIKQCIETGQSILNVPSRYATIGNRMVNSVISVFPLVSSRGHIDGAFCLAIDLRTIQSVLDDVLKSSQLIKDSQTESKTHFTFDSIIGNDANFIEIIEKARTSAISNSHIMIWGESGSGKELFAQSIHSASPRKSKPFIPINCAAIPDHLLEGILFGSLKGAYTGALNKMGLFEIAQGGTLFLDELNSMPVNLQAKILRAIQEKKIRRVGSLTEKRIDVRIISALNVDPRVAMQTNLLREDLFYRLGVVILEIPPLRNRKLDIVFLSQFFLTKHSKVLNMQRIKISDEVYSLFLEYNWKGNVRELEHVIEGALHMLHKGNTIYKKHLSSYFLESFILENNKNKRHKVDTNLSAYPSRHDSDNNSGKLSDLKEQYKEAEIIYIKKALQKAEGNIARASRYLGISAPNLHYKFRTLKIDPKNILL